MAAPVSRAPQLKNAELDDATPVALSITSAPWDRRLSDQAPTEPRRSTVSARRSAFAADIRPTRPTRASSSASTSSSGGAGLRRLVRFRRDQQFTLRADRDDLALIDSAPASSPDSPVNRTVGVPAPPPIIPRTSAMLLTSRSLTPKTAARSVPDMRARPRAASPRTTSPWIRSSAGIAAGTSATGPRASGVRPVRSVPARAPSRTASPNIGAAAPGYEPLGIAAPWALRRGHGENGTR